MLNVVLVEPEIPANTGNIGRTCVLTGSRLHLVGPLGFALDDHALKRAGLAYWESLDVRSYATWDAFLAAQETFAAGLEEPGEPRVHLLTKRGLRSYARTTYRDGDWLVFGKESAGLDAELLARHPRLCEHIPMRGGRRTRERPLLAAQLQCPASRALARRLRQLRRSPPGAGDLAQPLERRRHRALRGAAADGLRPAVRCGGCPYSFVKPLELAFQHPQLTAQHMGPCHA